MAATTAAAAVEAVGAVVVDVDVALEILAAAAVAVKPT